MKQEIMGLAAVASAGPYMMFIHHKGRRNTTKDRTDRVQNYMNYKLHSNLNF